jgi:hypothetical protein
MIRRDRKPWKRQTPQFNLGINVEIFFEMIVEAKMLSLGFVMFLDFNILRI